MTPHTTRHTVITWMLYGGVQIWEVSAFAGMRVEMIQRVCGHATAKSKQDAARALERAARQPDVALEQVVQRPNTAAKVNDNAPGTG